MSIRSMTGFARHRISTPEGELALSVKSVNHRGLDLHFHMSSYFDPLEAAMRTLAKQNAARGHVDIRCSFQRTGGENGLRLNLSLLAAYRDLFAQAARELEPMGTPDLNHALRLPGILIETQNEEITEDFQRAVLEGLEAVLAEWNVQREREGDALRLQMLEYNRSIQAAAAQIRGLRTGVLPVLRQRIEAKMRDLLEAAHVDPQRLAQEAAYLADRGDIEEELTRLLTHCQHLDQLLTKGGETGKKLDFLLQEMNRESNTILSKSNGAGDLGLKITELGLGIKSEIERIREQSLNLE